MKPCGISGKLPTRLLGRKQELVGKFSASGLYLRKNPPKIAINGQFSRLSVHICSSEC